VVSLVRMIGHCSRRFRGRLVNWLSGRMSLDRVVWMVGMQIDFSAIQREHRTTDDCINIKADDSS